jgi:superfamily II DNA or RNA helicase
VAQAERLVGSGAVLKADLEGKTVRGTVIVNSRELQTGLKLLTPTLVDSLCPCYMTKERGLICPHAIAVALVLVKRATDPLRDAKYREEQRRSRRLAAVNEADYIRRVPDDTPGALPARLELELDPSWAEGFGAGGVALACHVAAGGHRVPAGDVPRDVDFAFSRPHESLLYVLEDIAEGPLPSRLQLAPADFLNVVALHRGAGLAVRGADPLPVEPTPLSTYLHLDLDRETGELILFPHTEVPFAGPAETPRYFVHGREGWVLGAGRLWPLAEVLPAPYHGLYAGVITVARPDVPRFMQRELPLLAQACRIESDLSEDLFTIEPAAPRFRLAVRGSPASLSATLYAVYGDLELAANRPDARADFALPDPGDLLRYYGRNLPAEQQALEVLRGTGLAGEAGDALTPIIDKRHVMNFLGGRLPALRRLGWRVDIEGRVTALLEETAFVTPVVHIEPPPAGGGWFDVSFDYEDESGASISAADIQCALRKGEAFLSRGNRTFFIDADAVEAMGAVFEDCGGTAGDRPGAFRVGDIHAAFVKASLDALDGVDVESAPAWVRRAEQANRSLALPQAVVDPPLDGVLRPYQHEGVAWLRFLEVNGFGGLLADEMGLGKTLQTLAWLRMRRHAPACRDKPALVVCPTSLVGNWLQEAARFAPELRVLELSGSDRHNRWEDVPASDLAVTSYALLRRDADRYRDLSFSAVILDEAQHIKNRNTQNAVAARSLRAGQRLVLTGTPIENSVMDLWSIMEFLMPGYLGASDAFRLHYEQPIARGGPEAAEAQKRLRRKLQPFLLRRLKCDVARDLPPKIERVLTCRLSPDQALVYRELLAQSRRSISSMVSRQGFQRSRMEILALLMRLRQTCCHLDLLKLERLTAEQPSSKLDQFNELLDEALDAGHRVLVFSQFVGMLQILRTALAGRGIDHCYLDGSTRDRMAEVHRFNTRREIPVFLISLKAGGTGLNLTGADMVIHFDPWWNPAVENQATDRAHRIGQQRTVYSVKLITADTVEEKVLAMQKRKQAVVNATVESDEAVMQTLSWEDVQELIEL